MSFLAYSAATSPSRGSTSPSSHQTTVRKTGSYKSGLLSFLSVCHERANELLYESLQITSYLATCAFSFFFFCPGVIYVLDGRDVYPFLLLAVLFLFYLYPHQHHERSSPKRKTDTSARTTVSHLSDFSSPVSCGCVRGKNETHLSHSHPPSGTAASVPRSAVSRRANS